MNSKEQAAQQNGYLKFILPKNLEDPELMAVLRSHVIVAPGFMVSTIAIALSLFYIGMDRSAELCMGWVVMAGLSLLLMKMGYYNLSRSLYVVVLIATLVILNRLLGSSSNVWVYVFNISVIAPLVTAPAEKNVRKGFYVGTVIGVLCTFLLEYLDVIPSEVSPQYSKFISYLGMFNICAVLCSLAAAVLRHQAEVNLYKGRLLQQSLSMLQQAKMSSLGEMAGGVAHEINNPLAMILGHVTHLERELESGPQMNVEKMRDKTDKIKTTVTRISKIVSALRTFSRNADEDPFQSSPWSEILEATLSFCGENLRVHQIEVKISGEQNVQLECRPTQVTQVLISLINNSYDAIRNSAASGLNNEKWIEIHTEKSSERLLITVTDCGKGIPAAVAEKIMQPFFTTKEIGKGTGLGLSVSKGIMESHGGSLTLDRECANTRFVIELPLRQNQTGPDRQSSRQAS